MNYLKIENLLGECGVVDYKGIELKSIVPGSQNYKHDYSYCVLGTNQEVGDRVDVSPLTETEYNNEKELIRLENKNFFTDPVTVQDLEDKLDRSIIELSTLIAMGGM